MKSLIILCALREGSLYFSFCVFFSESLPKGVGTFNESVFVFFLGVFVLLCRLQVQPLFLSASAGLKPTLQRQGRRLPRRRNTKTGKVPTPKTALEGHGQPLAAEDKGHEKAFRLATSDSRDVFKAAHGCPCLWLREPKTSLVRRAFCFALRALRRQEPATKD